MFKTVLESLAKTICKDGIGEFGIGNNLQYMTLRETVRDILVHAVCHWEHVDGPHAREISRGQHGDVKKK